MCQVPECRPSIVGFDKSSALISLVHNPQQDTAFIEMFENQQDFHGFKWRNDGTSWFRFDGNLWRPSQHQDFTTELQRVATPALLTLVNFLKDHSNDMDLGQLREEGLHPKMIRNKLKLAHDYLQKKHGLTSVVDTAAMTLPMHDNTFGPKLDQNHDVAGAPNCVICLKTGDMLKGAADQYVSKQVGVAYKGLQQPTPDVDAFFNSIFNNDQDVILYIQKYLGYGLTGHVREQSFMMFWGGGSNGKSLLSDMLAKVFGEYYRCMSKDCLFVTDRRRAAGATSPHMADLQGVRLAVVDESKKNDILDTASIKEQTGSSSINCRPLYKNNIVFEVTHKPLLLTNFKPHVDIEDPAILRRLKVVPFNNVYKREGDYDATNPHHRLMDPDLGDRMLSEAVLSQFLTWLVQGSVQWYQGRLGNKPELMKKAEHTYIGENDFLGTFINDCCECAEGCMVETTVFRNALIAATEEHITAKDLKSQMEHRGYSIQRQRVNGSRQYLFVGLALVT